MDTIDWALLIGYGAFLYWVATTKVDPKSAFQARLYQARQDGKLNIPVRHEKKRDKRISNAG